MPRGVGETRSDRILDLRAGLQMAERGELQGETFLCQAVTSLVPYPKGLWED